MTSRVPPAALRRLECQRGCGTDEGAESCRAIEGVSPMEGGEGEMAAARGTTGDQEGCAARTPPSLAGHRAWLARDVLRFPMRVTVTE